MKIMVHHIDTKIVALIFAIAVAPACSKKGDANGGGGSSTLTINLPSSSGGSSKTISMSAIPSGQTMCYAVSVLGPGIPVAPANSCSPALGVSAGWTAAGGTIQLLVPGGDNRTVQLYGYLKAAGDNSPCPAFTSQFQSSMINQIYLMGQTTGVTIQGADAYVTIDATFPGAANTIASQMNLNTTCTAATAPLTTNSAYSVSAAKGKVTGGTYSLIGRIGTGTAMQTATGADGTKLTRK